MKKNPDNNLIVFLHMLKAGGTTINSIIKSQFEKNEVYLVNTKQYDPWEGEKYYNRERWLARFGLSKSIIPNPTIRRLKNKINQGKTKVISGHFDFSLVAPRAGPVCLDRFSAEISVALR